jgi:uncharacterized protein YqfB (UPF0267 family)
MKTKAPVRLNDVKGHIILKNETYYFQPHAIEDQKITLGERAIKPRKYVKRILIDKEYKTDKNDINDVIEKRISDLRVEIKKVVKDVKLGILEDMIIDRLDDEEFKKVIENKTYFESLRRGNYLLASDDSVDTVIYYDMFSDELMSDGKVLGYVLSKKYKEVLNTQVKSKFKDIDVRGFVDLVSTSKNKKEQVLKIKHLEGTKKVVGSACLSTSTLKIDTLKEFINDLTDRSLDMEKIKKKLLCNVYEYILRKEGKFARPVEYKLIKN